MLQNYVDRILKIAGTAISEAKLEGELNQVLKELLSSFDIPYDPIVNVTLKIQGLTQVNSNRPDSLFGHVVLDYKKPGTLEKAANIKKSRKQIEKYLDTITGSHNKAGSECERWAGILWDGFRLIFCRSDGVNWLWTKPYELSKYSLLTLIQIYRSLGKEPLTANRLNHYFGKNSDAAGKVLPVMCRILANPMHKTTMLFHEWKRLFEQVSTYSLSQLPSLKNWAKKNGIETNDAAHILFALHTYYSIVVKLLTAELLSSVNNLSGASLLADIVNAPTIEEIFRNIAKIENNDFYSLYRISNFLEGDFFSWYANEKSVELAEGFVQIARTLQNFEPATAKLKPEGMQDLLKMFYSSLVDEQIRHDLGEYYTPDWLAQYVLETVGYKGEPTKTVVDPACGSGTFLIECIAKLRAECERRGFPKRETLKYVLRSVKGLDLNPLAVISGRANYILAISDLVFDMGVDIEIPIYLADSINIPRENDDGTIEYTLDTEIEEYKFKFPVSLIENQVLGKILLACEEFICRNRSAKQLIDSLKRNIELKKYIDVKAEECITYFYDTIFALNARRPPWDSIWCRIVKNNFSPKGFGRVDYIVGNPPWVRWSRLPGTYRKRVKFFCEKYGLVSGKSYTGGIESDISTVLAFSAVDNWLKISGKIGILITWTVFQSASAKGFRLGKLPDGTGIKVDRIENLSSIQPFPDALNETGLYFAHRVENAFEIDFDEVPCFNWKAKNSSRIHPDIKLSDLASYVDIERDMAAPVSEFGSPLFSGKKSTFLALQKLRGKSAYLHLAHRGTVNDLARVYWVKVKKYSPETDRALIRTLNRDELPGARWVEPVDGAWIEAELLYPLLRGRETGRYCVSMNGWYQIVPNKHYSNVTNEDEFAEKYPGAFSYLMNYQHLLPNRSTYKRYLKKLPPYCIYCIGEYSFAPYKVVWPEQQNPTRFRAAVIGSVDDTAIIPNRIIVPDHKLYFAGFNNMEEAHFLCAFINSPSARKWLGGFLLGKQIGTTIFEFMKVPRFEPGNAQHQRLAEISIQAHEKRENQKNKELLHHDKEKELEELLSKIIGGIKNTVNW